MRLRAYEVVRMVLVGSFPRCVLIWSAPKYDLHPRRHINSHCVLPRPRAQFQRARNVEWTREGFVGVLRECYAFVEDYGYDTGGEYNGRVVELRQRFEELLRGGDTNVGGGGGMSVAGTGAGAGAGNGNGNGNGGGGNMSEGNGSGYNRYVCLGIWTFPVYFRSYVGMELELFFRFFGSLSSLRV